MTTRRTTLAILGATILASLQPLPLFAEEDAAAKAVEAAKAFAGTTINVAEEAGLMAMLGINVTGPEWERLTGIKVKVSELPYEELFTKQLLEHKAGSGAYDVLTIGHSWVADLVLAGALEPLDPLIEKYGVKEEFDDIVPAFREGTMYQGATYALAVDGDVHVLYYRKDIFEDPAMQEAFKAKYGYDLAPPTDYGKFNEVCQFITDQTGGKVYGAGLINTGYQHFFFGERFRLYGGKYFDEASMKAQINSEAGVRAVQEMVDALKCQPPGAATWGFGESLSALNSGEIAMTITWPPVARWAQGINADEQALSWVPESTVVDKIGYALTPGGHPSLVPGIQLSLSSDSKNKDAAYLYMQWLTSKTESLKNVMRPIGLRDPFRYSHFDSPEFQALWPTAPNYLSVLREGDEKGYADFAVLETYKYTDTLARAVIAAIGGKDPKAALDEAAAQWDAITQQVGVDRQREAYKAWASRPSAYRM